MNQIYEKIIDGLSEDGYCVYDDFLSAELVLSLQTLLLERHEEGVLKKAGIGKDAQHTKNEAIRGDLILWLEEDSPKNAEQSFLAVVKDFMLYLNQTCYTGLQQSEFHYTFYPVGSFYKKHVDYFTTNQSRRFSLIAYLNDNWEAENGGELVLYLPDGTEKRILPIGGRMVCFRSNLLPHEVLPATRPRMSLTGWLKT